MKLELKVRFQFALREGRRGLSRTAKEAYQAQLKREAYQGR